MRDEPEYTIGSGNVFADLGLPDSDELIVKAEITRQISSIIEHRHLTQVQAAELLGTTQPRVSDLVRGKLEKFSMDQLLQFLTALDRDVEIIIRRKPRGRAHGQIRVAAG